MATYASASQPLIVAGRLDQRLTLQAPATTEDELGQPVAGWSTVGTVWASAAPLRGRELMAAAAGQSEATVRFRIRWRADVTRAWRVLWRGVAYAIESDPIDVHGQRQALELMCTTAGAQP